MHQFRLPSGHQAIPLQSLRTHHPGDRPLCAGDRATSVMIDLQRDAVLTVTEDMDVELVLDAVFRLGVRIFLVVREHMVVGLVSAHVARRASAAAARAAKLHEARCVRVAEAMVPCALAPAADWQMVQQWSIADLLEIFAACDADFLVVLEDDSTAADSRVRGLIARDRLERQLPALAS